MTTPFEELLQKTEGELTSRRAAELEEALTSSPVLQAEQRRVEQLIDAVSRPAPGVETVDLREGLWAREVPAPRRVRRWPFVVAFAAAVMVALVFIPRGEEFGVKGSTGSVAGFEAFTVEGQPLGKTMHATDALGFAYRNLPDSPWRSLMIYGVDARGEVFWFYPQWAVGEAPPSSVPIVASSERVSLPLAVRHELQRGPLVLHALFTKQPLSVTEVEAGRVPSDAVQHVTLAVEVTE